VEARGRQQGFHDALLRRSSGIDAVASILSERTDWPIIRARPRSLQSRIRAVGDGTKDFAKKGAYPQTRHGNG
jgi:hypothetical protein